MRLLWLCALPLLMSSGCSLKPPKAPEIVQVPVFQPLECNDQALEACAGVPARSYETAEGLALGLGEAIRALLDCMDLHDELLMCVRVANEKAARVDKAP